MKPADFEKIGVFLGWRKECDHHGEFWAKEVRPGFWDWCKDVEECELTDEEAVEALNVLVAKGYHPELYYSVDADGFAAWHFSENPAPRRLFYIGESVHGAVEAALQRLCE